MPDRSGVFFEAIHPFSDGNGRTSRILNLLFLFHQPYAKARFLVEAGIAQRQTAADHLKEIERIGILRSHKIEREKLYLNVRLLELLSASEPSQ